MAHQIIEITTLDDHGHFGQTNYYCSECGLDCGKQTNECPHCKTIFDKGSIFKDNGYPFGGSDF